MRQTARAWMGVLVFAAVFVLAATPAAADMSVVLEDRVEHPDAGSWGIKINRSGEDPGRVEMEILVERPKTSHLPSVGLVVFNKRKQPQYMIAISFVPSRERTVVRAVPGENNTLNNVEDEIEEMLSNINVSLDNETSNSGSDSVISGVTVILRGFNKTKYYLPWATMGSAANLTIRGENGTRAAAKAGFSYGAMDQDIDDDTNIEVQRTFSEEDYLGKGIVEPTGVFVNPYELGVKVVKDATFPVETEHRLWGFFGLADFKLACSFKDEIDECVWASTAYRACEYLLGISCSPGSISWTGPGREESGYSHYAMKGYGPGSYNFTVDRKADFYGPWAYNYQTRTGVWIGEHHTFLTLADATLPS